MNPRFDLVSYPLMNIIYEWITIGPILLCLSTHTLIFSYAYLRRAARPHTTWQEVVVKDGPQLVNMAKQMYKYILYIQPYEDTWVAPQACQDYLFSYVIRFATVDKQFNASARFRFNLVTLGWYGVRLLRPFGIVDETETASPSAMKVKGEIA